MDGLLERRWLVRGLYTVLIAGEIVMMWEAWSQTPAGERFRASMAERVGRLRARAKGCEGCAERRETLRRWAHLVGGGESATMEAEAIVRAEGS